MRYVRILNRANLSSNILSAFGMCYQQISNKQIMLLGQVDRYYLITVM